MRKWFSRITRREDAQHVIATSSNIFLALAAIEAAVAISIFVVSAWLHRRSGLHPRHLPVMAAPGWRDQPQKRFDCCPRTVCAADCS
jgi:hypothetical protein